jgi:hypothetical protein
MLYIRSVDEKNPIGKAVQNYANSHFNNGFICGVVMGFCLGAIITVGIIKKN